MKLMFSDGKVTNYFGIAKNFVDFFFIVDFTP